MEKLFLLDAYALIYRAYFAFIRSPRINSKGMNTSTILGFVNTLEYILKKEHPTHIGVAFDPSEPTFRHKMFEAYKAQREKTPEDITKSVPIIKEIIKAYNIPILEVPGFEADDVIGTLATKASQRGIITYMVTPDKDYGQLVRENVYMFKPRSGEKEFELMGTEEIKAKFQIDNTEQVIDILGLMGDKADNIPGCPGIGETTAPKLIKEFGSIENLLENTDMLKGALKKKVEDNKEQIKFSKLLATIRTDVEIELEMEKLKTESPDEQKLREIFEELEFRTLTERIFKKPPTLPNSQNNDLFSQSKPKKTKVTELMGDLFAPSTNDNTEAEKHTSLTRLHDTRHSYHLIDNIEDAEKLCELLLTKQFVSLDTETTSTDSLKAELVGLSFSFEKNHAFYVAIPENKDEALKFVNLFKPFYENTQIVKIGQNIKYDIHVLASYDIEVDGPVFDTMIAHYLLQPELQHNMDYLAEVYLNYQTIKIEELIGEKGKGQKNMRTLPPSQVYEYACEDADITWQLYETLKVEIEKENLNTLCYDIEMPLVKVLADMERIGVRVDTKTLQETSRQYTKRMMEIEKEIYTIAGTTFNISSPKQVGEVLFDRLKITDKPKKTKTGQYVTSEEVLEDLRHKHPIIEKILEHRGLKKLINTYLDALPALINPKTGKIHTSFNQAITSTGRLSSSNPNLQNIPVKNEEGKEIRKAFIPDEGEEFFSADYSQIELRIMAHLSQDSNMVEAFNEGNDIHAATAAKVYKINIEDVSREQRSKAKTANFGIIYGISVFGLAERMNVPRSEAKELIDGYFKTYPRIKEYMNESIERARQKGYIETLFGRKRYLPDINSHNAVVRGYAERNAINAPIQGSAADIIKIAMVNIWRRFKEEQIQSKMILQVHDELNFSVLPSEKEKVESIVTEEMEHAYTMSVPLKADSGWGMNWLEAH
ncbi:MAG: DNA polymerase I [Bacteroidales bacterium]|nr:DNA polymerase I [Bacteroidales bacterium]